MQSAQFELHAQIEERHWWFVARRQILSSVVRSVLPPSPETTIVDVGCGTGANLAGLAGDYRCLGIDTSADAIRLARQRFPNVTFVQGFAPRDLGKCFAEARLVLLCDVLEHVPDDFALFSELLAAASPGTWFLITVPAEMALWSEHDRAFGHYRRYDAKRFQQIWQALPVRTRFVSHFNSRLYPVVKAVRGWNRLRHRSAGAVGTDFKLPSAPVNNLLARTFAGERHRLAGLARGEQTPSYGRGVSLMALVERLPGAVETRTRPEFVPPDLHDPASEWGRTGELAAV